MNEWEEFGVGVPSTKENWDEKTCAPFQTVSHVSHVHTALEIIRTGKIKAGLVFNGNNLNKKRVLVSWVSPNIWTDGFRYGNISFKFDFEELIQDKSYYWVEFFTYGVPTCSIMITNHVHADLKEYKPEDGAGPWWYDTKNNMHYFNNEFFLEFLIEDDLTLDQVISIDAVSHHNSMCSENSNTPESCPYIGMGYEEARGLFVAALIGRNQSIDVALFTTSYTRNKEVPGGIYDAFVSLYKRLIGLNKRNYGGKILHTDAVAEAITRAACNSYATNRNSDIAKFQACFVNSEEYEKSLAMVIGKHFDLSDYRLLLED